MRVGSPVVCMSMHVMGGFVGDFVWGVRTSILGLFFAAGVSGVVLV